MGVICFNAETKVIQEVVSVANILRDRVATMVQKQEAVGGTNLAHALLVASRLLTHILAHDTNVNADGYVPPPSLLETGIDTAPRESPLANIGQVSVDVEMASTRPTENRILVITDEYLNASDDHQESFRVMQRIADESNIHTTFVAVGTGYSPGVTKKIRSIPGCSSSSVHSVEELEQRVLHDFDKTCFPVAYDVSIEVDSPTLNVLEPFGSAQGKFLIKEKTLFAGSGDDSVSVCNMGTFCVFCFSTPEEFNNLDYFSKTRFGKKKANSELSHNCKRRARFAHASLSIAGRGSSFSRAPGTPACGVYLPPPFIMTQAGFVLFQFYIFCG